MLLADCSSGVCKSIWASGSLFEHVMGNHVGHKGTTKMLAQIKETIKWDQRRTSAEKLKSWRPVWGWNLRAHRGPHGVKHKGPISCSQHKQNGHRSSSVALTYRFSHFTDFPTLRIIIWPRALSFKGINRSEDHLCWSQSSFSSLHEHVTLLDFPQPLPTKYLFSLLTCISAAAGALSFQS